MRYLLAIAASTSIWLGASAQSLYFPPNSGTTWDTLNPQSLQWCSSAISDLYAFLDSNDTKAFIVLKDGKVVLEQYFDSHTPNSVWPWNSAGKTITSFLVGIAQEEGHLSINDSASAYLGHGWTQCTPSQEREIQIVHQLSMTSGLDDAVADPFCTLDTCLSFKANAGTRWAYHNAPYTLLDSVIHVATGTTLNSYVQQKLKAPTGMTGGFVSIGYNRVYVSTARSMARFGLLILSNGIWNGDTLLGDSVFKAAMRSPSQSINPSYGYLWWLNGKPSYRLPSTQFNFQGWLNPSAPADMIAAWGKDGQMINVVPSQNLVVVRMGNAPDGNALPNQFNNQLWDYLNLLNCGSIGTVELGTSLPYVWPNPVSEEFRLTSFSNIERVEVQNLAGQNLINWDSPTADARYPVTSLSPGNYVVRIWLLNGEIHHCKFIK